MFYQTGGASWRDESCTDMDMEIVKVSCAKLILEESANIAAYICKLLEDAHSPGLFARLLDNRKRFALADSKDEADSANMMKYMPPKVPCQTEKEEFLSALREDVMRFYWMQQWKKSASRNNSEVSLFHSLSKKYGWDTFEQLPEQERRTFLYLGAIKDHSRVLISLRFCCCCCVCADRRIWLQFICFLFLMIIIQLITYGLPANEGRRKRPVRPQLSNGL